MKKILTQPTGRQHVKGGFPRRFCSSHLLKSLLFFSFLWVHLTAAGQSFRVDGARILDPNGNEFVIKGVNINGPEWVWPIEMTQHADMIARDWKFNAVRVNATVTQDHFNDNNDIDKIVTAFTSRKVVVIFEAHDWTGAYPSGTDLTALRNWHKNLAARYKDNTYVWFNVMNEPGWCQQAPQEWLTVHESVIQTIRNEGASNIIVADGIAWGQESGCSDNYVDPAIVPTDRSAILTYGPTLTAKYSNILFSFHVYCGWNGNGDAKMADYLNRVKSKGLAIFVGEYGVSGGENCDSRAATKSMFNVVVPRKIGRMVWHWYGGDQNTLTNTSNPSGGWKIDNTTSPTNLTWLGKLVWDDNRSSPGNFVGFYKIEAKHSGKVLDVSNNGTSDGSSIIQYDYTGGNNQQWKLEVTPDGYYQIRSRHSQKVLAVENTSTANGARVVQWTASGSADSQKWKLEDVGGGYYKITAKHSGKVLDVAGVSYSNGANVLQYTYGGGDNQKWKLTKVADAARIAAADNPVSEAETGQVTVYPNPTGPKLHVSMHLAEPAPIRVELTNSLGQKLYSSSSAGTRGSNHFALGTHAFKNGLYILTIRNGDKQITRKVLIEK